MARGDLTLYMAVPTVYRRLIDAWESADETTRIRWSEGARKLRLMVSGSAALPVPTLERWREITGQLLLERYGMTEIGMGLSNPLHGERRPGHVGQPLPGQEVRLVDEDDVVVEPGQAGQIQVRGPAVGGEYWRRPEATAGAFTPDGWFRTGDRAILVDGAEMSPVQAQGVTYAMDSNDNGTETTSSPEGHAIVRHTGVVPAGTYTITVQAQRSSPTTSFALADWVLVGRAVLEPTS